MERNELVEIIQGFLDEQWYELKGYIKENSEKELTFENEVAVFDQTWEIIEGIK